VGASLQRARRAWRRPVADRSARPAPSEMRCGILDDALRRAQRQPLDPAVQARVRLADSAWELPKRLSQARAYAPPGGSRGSAFASQRRRTATSRRTMIADDMTARKLDFPRPTPQRVDRRGRCRAPQLVPLDGTSFNDEQIAARGARRLERPSCARHRGAADSRREEPHFR